MGFGDWISHNKGSNEDPIPRRNLCTDSPWHETAVQLLKLLPMFWKNGPVKKRH